MRAPLALLLAVCATIAAVHPQASTPAPFDHSHARWTEVLRERVRDGGFDYGGLKADRAAFDAYLASLRAVTPEQLADWSEAQRFAFWINTYNAFCIQKVVDEYPLKSIRKLSGIFGTSSVFDQRFIPMNAHHPKKVNEPLSLNDIEHEILRKRFADARLHAAINCASVSCPPLRAEAYTAAALDTQLTEQMRAFVNDPTRNRIDPAKGELAVSEVFKWFEEDFERDAGSVKEYLIRYAPPEAAEFVRKTRLGYLEYDWALNDAPRK